MTPLEIDLTPQLAAALAQYETARERRIAALTAGPWWSHARADDECSRDSFESAKLTTGEFNEP